MKKKAVKEMEETIKERIAKEEMEEYIRYVNAHTTQQLLEWVFSFDEEQAGRSFAKTELLRRGIDVDKIVKKIDKFYIRKL